VPINGSKRRGRDVGNWRIRRPPNEDRSICRVPDPPLPRVGLSEDEAQRKGIRSSKLPKRNLLRTQATDEAVVRAIDDRILGLTMIGSEAGEVLVAIQTASLAELPTRSCVTPSSRGT
jgi:pyruvate/2-oxoglutarate dehydrogenase complex dihydrolipoamide dehydrogenase (E3) component